MDLSDGSAWPFIVWLGLGALLVTVAVAVDARARGLRVVPWVLLSLAIPGYGAIVYLIWRPVRPAQVAASVATHDGSKGGGETLGGESVAGAEPSSSPSRSPEFEPLAAPAPSAMAVPGSAGTTPGAATDAPAARAGLVSRAPSGGAGRAPGSSGPSPLGGAPGAPDGPGRLSDSLPPAPATSPTEAREAAARPRASAAVPAGIGGRGGTVEWRRSVGVLPGTEPVEHSTVLPAPPRPLARGRARVPAWVIGAAAAVVVLVGIAALGLPGVPSTPSPPPATATIVGRPSLPSIGAPEPEGVVLPVESVADPPRPMVYVVEPGDSLGGIALEFSTTVEALMAANNLSDADTVLIGQELIVSSQ